MRLASLLVIAAAVGSSAFQRARVGGGKAIHPWETPTKIMSPWWRTILGRAAAIVAVPIKREQTVSDADRLDTPALLHRVKLLRGAGGTATELLDGAGLAKLSGAPSPPSHEDMDELLTKVMTLEARRVGSYNLANRGREPLGHRMDQKDHQSGRQFVGVGFGGDPRYGDRGDDVWEIILRLAAEGDRAAEALVKWVADMKKFVSELYGVELEVAHATAIFMDYLAYTAVHGDAPMLLAVWKSNCEAPHDIDAMVSPQLRLHNVVEVPRHRRDVAPVTASAR